MKIEFIHSRKMKSGGYWLATCRNKQGRLMLIEGAEYKDAFNAMCKILRLEIID